MAVSPDVLTAIRELTNAKQLDRAELFGLLQDGILAALQKKYGPTVQAEVDIDDATDALYLQIPPNMGVLNPVGTQLGISPGRSFALDIGTTRGGENIPFLINGNRLFRPGLLSGLAFSGRVVQGLNVPVRDVAVLSVN